MPQTITDLGKKVKAKYPGQYDDLSDDELGRKVKAKYPGAYDDFSDVEAGPPGPQADMRTAGQVAYDQAGAVGRGIFGLPSALPSIAGGMIGMAKKALTGDAVGLAQDVRGALQPLETTARGLGALAMPNTVQAPSREEWEQAAEGAGTNLAMTALPYAAIKAAPAFKAVAAKVAPRLKSTTAPAVNRWMQVEPKEMIHGANPAEQVMKEGLLGKDKVATQSNVKTALKDAGQQIDTKLRNAGAMGARIDASNHVINALNNAVEPIGAPTEVAFQNQLNSILTKILKKYPNLNDLTPAEAHALKVEIGDSVKWTGAAYDSAINQALVDMYGAINADIKAVANVGAEMERWGNLYQADKALEKGIVANKAGTGTEVRAPSRYRSAVKTAAKIAIPAAAGAAAYQVGRDLIKP